MMTRSQLGRRAPQTKLTRALFVVIALLALVPTALAQATDEFRRTFTVTSKDAVALDIEVPQAELKILYNRDGQVSITAQAQASGDAKLDSNFFKTVLSLEQDGNRFILRQAAKSAYVERGISVLYTIEVPYRTAVTTKAKSGNQTFSGITGPVTASTGNGDIKASYISKALQAEVGSGDLDVEVIGEHVQAKVGEGNIICSRLPQGVTAETEKGDITFMVVGSSTATVKAGSGRIEVGGARGSFAGSTAAGDIHIKAVPHGEWQLKSSAGNVRLDLPPQAAFELDASGELRLDRDDISRSAPEVAHFHQKVNGGGNLIVAQTDSGRIIIR